MSHNIAAISEAAGDAATMTAMLEKLKQEARNSWPGATGEDRAKQLSAFLAEMLNEYSAVLGESEADLLTAFENRRNYSAINYYQRANFPKLDGVMLLADMAEFRSKYPSGKYICPACSGESTDPYECDSGKQLDTKPCNWKSYGLFRTMGKGLRIAFRTKFLEHPRVEEIFMPVEAVVGSGRVRDDAAKADSADSQK